MDPDATLALLLDETNDLDERAVAAVDLLVWIAKGGHISLHREGLRPQADTISDCQHAIFKALDRLAELEDRSKLCEWETP